MFQISKSHLTVDDSNFDENGYLLVDGVMARIGVQVYITPDGIQRQLRTPENVQASISSFARKPITLDHPSVAVTRDNHKDLSVGNIVSAFYENGLVKPVDKIAITDTEAIKAAMSSHKELSVGYHTDIVEESGIWTDEFGVQGEPGKTYEYDAVQTNIVVNHIALVQRGRAGKVASLNFDSEDNIYNAIQITENNRMNKITIDGKDYNESQIVDLFHNLNKDHASVLAELTAQVAKLTADSEETNGKLIAAELSNKELQSKLDNVTTDADINAEIASRMEAWSIVAPHLDGAVADYSLSVAAIERLGVSKLAPSLSLDGFSDATIHGIWLGLTANLDSKDIGHSSSKEEMEEDESEEMKEDENDSPKSNLDSAAPQLNTDADFEKQVADRRAALAAKLSNRS